MHKKSVKISFYMSLFKNTLVISTAGRGHQ